MNAGAAGVSVAGETVLLDAVDRRVRALQHVTILLGIFLLFTGGAIAMRQGAGPRALAALGAGLVVIASAMFARQRWEVEYRGHRIRFENGPTTAEQLFVDGRLVGRGGFGRVRTIATVLPSGERITAVSRADLLSFGCRIVARAAGRHYLLFYDVVGDYVERRAAYRAEHLALAQVAVARGELVLGGALADPVDGAVLLFHGDAPAVAERFAAADPYVRNGLVTRWRVRPWTTVVGQEAATPVPATTAGEVVP